MKITQNEKLLFIGDSVTDCDRARPVGEGLFDALGKGYVTLVNGLLQSTYPELGIRVVNQGISGNNVRDLKSRWQEDVIDQKPNHLVIMIGINDVWRQYDIPLMTETHVYIDEYEATLRELIEITKKALPNIHLTLMTPFYIEPNAQDAMRQTMDQYGRVIESLAQQQNCGFVDTQAAFNKVLEQLYPAAIAWDRVHPNPTGHLVLAKAFLNHVQFKWDHQ